MLTTSFSLRLLRRLLLVMLMVMVKTLTLARMVGTRAGRVGSTSVGTSTGSELCVSRSFDRMLIVNKFHLVLFKYFYLFILKFNCYIAVIDGCFQVYYSSFGSI